jgi:hypothetical protein
MFAIDFATFLPPRIDGAPLRIRGGQSHPDQHPDGVGTGWMAGLPAAPFINHLFQLSHARGTRIVEQLVFALGQQLVFALGHRGTPMVDGFIGPRPHSRTATAQPHDKKGVAHPFLSATADRPSYVAWAHSSTVPPFHGAGTRIVEGLVFA